MITFWALVNSDQFMQGIDYEILATNGENTTVLWS